MAESGSIPQRHFDLEHCLRFLESENSTKQLLNHAVSRYQKFVVSGPDPFLLLFQKSLRSHDVKKILSYLRNFGILDLAECERIESHSISDLMVTELVSMVYTKDPHAFWYFAHSLKTNALFQFFHGGIHCCVCEEVHGKEKEIDETLLPFPLPEGNGTTFTLTVAPKAEITKFFEKLKRLAADGKWTKDTKKKLQIRTREFQNRLDDIRQVVGPPIQELREAVKIVVKKAMDSKDSPLMKEEIFNKKGEKQSQQLPEVLIAIQDEEPEEKEEDALSAAAEKGTKPVYQDEEAGYKMPPNEKPKLSPASVPTLDAVEGRKKYIAFVIVSIFTLYSYVDSIIKIVPV